MELVKETDKYSIYKKRSGRFGVKDPKQKWLNGEEKAKILSTEGLIKLSKANARPAEEVEQAPEKSAE